MDKKSFERERKRVYRKRRYTRYSTSSSEEDFQEVDVLENVEVVQESSSTTSLSDAAPESPASSPRNSPVLDFENQPDSDTEVQHEDLGPVFGLQADETQELDEDGDDSENNWGQYRETDSEEDEEDDNFQNNLENSSEGEEDAGNYDDDVNTPLFEGARLTLIQSFVSLLAIFFKCKLSIQTFKIIIGIIALHLPQNSKFFSSLHHFNKFLPNNRMFVKRNRYCKNCYIVDGFGDCSCNKKDNGHFLTFSIPHQLDVLYQRESFRNLINHRFNRVKKNELNIEDLYDGELYKSYLNNGFLRDRYNISLMWYTDGVPLYKSSKYSVWPLFFIINELPYAVRYLPENVLFGGLWYGSSKPYFNSFLLPLHDDLNTLQTTGVTLTARDERGDKIRVKAKILFGCCDLPARALVLNMNQFNGFYSCHKCLIKGEKHFFTETRSVFVFPNPKNNEAVPLRNLRDTKIHSNEAIGKAKPVYGMKGPTLLAKFVPNIIVCTAIDSMHAVFSGVVKKMVALFFSSTYSSFPFSLYNVSKTVDDRIKSIKPPNFVNRLPRDFGSHMSYLKSSEFKVWFFYYSIPILLDLLQEPYLSHYITLVEACMLLSGESISIQDIDRAEILLRQYVMNYENYFGIRFMTANIHSLLHIADTVRHLGPLWVSSCFPLEDLNGKLTRLVHGTRCAETQIWKSFLSLQKLPKHQANVRDNPALSKFLESLKNNVKCNLTKEIECSVYVVGKMKFLHAVPNKIYNAFDHLGVELNKVWIFYRLRKGSLLYTCVLYNQNIQTFSKCVSYINRNNVEMVGLIHCFLHVKECSCIEENVCGCVGSYYAVIKKFNEVEIENCGFVKEIVCNNEYEAINIRNLNSINYCVAVVKKLFCIKPVKAFEFE